MKKAVFLDRDGVINRGGDQYYICKPEQFVLNPGITEALYNWQQQGYMLIVISNQGGISRGRCQQEQVEATHAHMQSLLKEKGVELTEVYYCPHHDAEEACLCRKPSGLMIEKALARFEIDPAKAVMIGDSARDVEAAKAAGIKGIRIPLNADLRKIDLSKEI